ncbi:MAG TPA: uroporphyrinogen decarboxylase [Thermomicrobiales bacterium]|nr:uroporphyrinogen decarboxylase [Thermomicrobiales bacterium]
MTTTPFAPAAAPAMTGRVRFLAALRRQPVDATPVWFMRQAGRSLPDYRALREKHAFMTLATTPELAAAATLLPVDRLGVDAAVLFADIMLPLTGMGARFEIRPNAGPIIPDPIRTDADVARLRVPDPEESTPYVFDALRLLRSELGERAALLGFAGAPFTLACYLIEGKASREFPRAKALMYGRPDLWRRLMDVLTETTIGYLNGQIAAGADAIQLFDSWLGLLGPDAYERHVLPYTRRIFAALPADTPAIHFSTGTTALIAQIATTSCAAVSVDWRLPLDAAWARLGPTQAIQGNLDPTMLLADWATTRQGALDVLRRAGGRLGHIFNLGHGVLPETDPDRLARLVELVHAHGPSGR